MTFYFTYTRVAYLVYTGKGALMQFKFLKVVGASILLASGPNANAYLIDFIDNGKYTTDTREGLDWLDWSSTTAMTQADALNLYRGDRYRVASSTEIETLLYDFFQVSPSRYVGNYLPMRSYSEYYPLQQIFAALFGATSAFHSSYVALDTEGLFGADPLNTYAGCTLAYCGMPGYAFTNAGIPLVRSTVPLVPDSVVPVPVPGTLAIFALGLVAMVSRRFKKQA
jgi:hypothetical protein